MTFPPQLTVTVPDQADIAGLGELPEGVSVVAWNPRDRMPEQLVNVPIDLLLVPHYFFSRTGWARIRDTPQIRAVQLPSAGYDHAIRFLPDGALLCNGRGIHDAETAELTLGLILASLRGIDVAARNMTDGIWDNQLHTSLVDRKVTVIGAGAVGKAIITRLRAFETEVSVVATHRRSETIGGVATEILGMDELPAVLPQTEVLVLAVPSASATHHLVDAALLAQLPDNALVVNIARGQVVDTQALVSELAAGRLHAALDVTDPEPLPADHPLWHTPNTLITAHMGGNTTATFPRTLKLLRNQIAHLHAGEPLENLVDYATGN